MGNGEMKLNRYPKYKPTGIAWLPEVPEGWEVAMVGHCYDIQLGKMLCSEQRDASYSLEPYYCAANVHFEGVQATGLKQMWFSEEEKKVYRVLNGDLLIVEGGAGAGGSAIVKNHQQEAYMQNSILRVRHRANTDNTFLCYWMEAIVKRGYVDVVCNKATIPHFTKEKVSRVPFPLPPLPTQRVIVAFLDGKCGKIDRWVAAKEREVALLKELKQAMIAEAVTGATHVARTDTTRKMKPSGIPWFPEVPEGWEAKSLRQFLKMVSRKGFPEKQLLSVTREQGVVVRNVESKEENHNFIPDDLSNYKLVEIGDFAINKMKSWQGSYGVSDYEGIVSPAYYICKLSGVDRNFFSVAIRSRPYVSFFARFSKGIRVDQWDLSPVGLKEIPFLLPPLAEQRAIVAYIEARAAKIDAAVAGLEREVAAMKEYKQRLIADVVTGQRKVA